MGKMKRRREGMGSSIPRESAFELLRVLCQFGMSWLGFYGPGLFFRLQKGTEFKTLSNVCAAYASISVNSMIVMSGFCGGRSPLRLIRLVRIYLTIQLYCRLGFLFGVLAGPGKWHSHYINYIKFPLLRQVYPLHSRYLILASISPIIKFSLAGLHKQWFALLLGAMILIIIFLGATASGTYPLPGIDTFSGLFVYFCGLYLCWYGFKMPIILGYVVYEGFFILQEYCLFRLPKAYWSSKFSFPKSLARSLRKVQDLPWMDCGTVPVVFLTLTNFWFWAKMKISDSIGKILLFLGRNVMGIYCLQYHPMFGGKFYRYLFRTWEFLALERGSFWNVFRFAFCWCIICVCIDLYRNMFLDIMGKLPWHMNYFVRDYCRLWKRWRLVRKLQSGK
jgi:hypothetical protein